MRFSSVRLTHPALKCSYLCDRMQQSLTRFKSLKMFNFQQKSSFLYIYAKKEGLGLSGDKGTDVFLNFKVHRTESSKLPKHNQFYLLTTSVELISLQYENQKKCG